MSLTESHVEEATLEWFASVGYTVAHGPDLAPGEPGEERASFHDVVLVGRLQAALARVNPTTPAAALDDALRAALRTESPLPHENNRRFHRLLTHGVDVEYRKGDRTVHEKAWLVDFENPEKNDWLVVNQYTVIEGQKNRRPDVVVFVNGLPLAVLELKNAADEDATIRSAFHQLQTYKNDIPVLFPFNAVLVVSDGLEARMGTVTFGLGAVPPLAHHRGRGCGAERDAGA
jgi:type I restriction enzyme R subunit